MISKNSTNPELLANPEIRELLEKGHVVLVDKAATTNDDFTTLFLACMGEGGSSSLNKAQTMLLGFDRQVIRGVQNAATAQADLIEIGQSLNELFDADFALQIEDSFEPSKDFDQKPRLGRNRDNDELETLVCKETGKPIYRNVELVPREELNNTIINTVLESQYSGDKVVKKEKIVAQA